MNLRRPHGRLVQTFGPKIGQCNVCGAVGPLTTDHSPPKSCLRPTAVQVRHITEMLSVELAAERTKGRFMQNGLSFRTLCHRCNNDYLGLRYDPELARFNNAVTQFLTSSLTLPPVATIRGNPQRMMRSIFGHIAAQGVDRYLKGPETEALADWFKDETLPLPAGVRFYYWPFPHQGCVIFRDAAYLSISRGEPVAIWLLKFFPVAFLMTFEKPGESFFTLPRLSEFDTSLPVEVDLPLVLHTIPHRYWPEAPTDDSAITYGKEAMFSVPHVRAG